MKDIVLAISGMNCASCLNAVNRALAGVPGIEVCSVRVGRADLRVPDGPDGHEGARSAIESAGYKVEGIISR